MVGVSITLLWASRPDVSHGWDPGSESIPNFSEHLVTKICAFGQPNSAVICHTNAPFSGQGSTLGGLQFAIGWKA